MNVREAIQDIVANHLWDLGPAGRSLRLGKIAEMLLRTFPQWREFVEIGGGYGQTTVELCRAAIQYNGRVTVIDAWDGDYNFDEFLRAVQADPGDLEKVLTIVRARSQSDQGKQALSMAAKALLVFVDGDETAEGIAEDITNAIVLSSTVVICVDDINHKKGRQGVLEGVQRSKLEDRGYAYIKTAGGIEGYWIAQECEEVTACTS